MPQSHGENQLYGIILNHVHHQCIMARSTLLIMKLISKEPAGENQTIFTNKLTAAISKASDIDASLRPNIVRTPCASSGKGGRATRLKQWPGPRTTSNRSALCS